MLNIEITIKKKFPIIMLLAYLFLYLIGCSPPNKSERQIVKPAHSPQPTTNSTHPPIEDDNYFYQYRGDLSNTGQFSHIGPTSPKILWKFKTNGKIRGSAAILKNQNIVIGTQDSSLFIISPDGKEEKKVLLDSWVFSSPVIGPGGLVYVGCDNGDLLCIDSGGLKKWKFKISAETSSSPAIIKDKLYLGAEDNAVHCIGLNGKELWKFKLKKRVLFSSPALDSSGGAYIGVEDGFIYKIKSDGSLGWKFDTGSEISTSSPVIAPDGTVYIVSSDAKVFALDNKGRKKWVFTAHEEIFCSPALARSGNIYAAALDGVFMALSPQGKLLWKKKIAPQIYSSAVIDGADNIYAVGTGVVVKMNQKGDILWRKEINGKHCFKADPIITPGGQILFGGEDGVLYCVGNGLSSSVRKKVR